MMKFYFVGQNAQILFYGIFKVFETKMQNHLKTTVRPVSSYIKSEKYMALNTNKLAD